jgi:hypothetical protein
MDMHIAPGVAKPVYDEVGVAEHKEDMSMKIGYVGLEVQVACCKTIPVVL